MNHNLIVNNDINSLISEFFTVIPSSTKGKHFKSIESDFFDLLNKSEKIFFNNQHLNTFPFVNILFKDKRFQDFNKSKKTEEEINDLFNNPEKIIIELSLAGYKKEDINIEFKDKNLFINNIVNDIHSNNKEGEINSDYFIRHKGISNKNWERPFVFNRNIKEVQPTLEDGILRLEVSFINPSNERTSVNFS